jgi:hypothetical protein
MLHQPGLLAQYLVDGLVRNGGQFQAESGDRLYGLFAKRNAISGGFGPLACALDQPGIPAASFVGDAAQCSRKSGSCGVSVVQCSNCCNAQ